MLDDMIKAVRGAKCVAAMTGAGVSTLCGIPDFRGPKGLYKNPDAERIFDIDWFDRDPAVYYRGCSELVYGLGAFEPGPVHRALKRLEDAGRLDGIITQNIDMLHQKAGSSNVYEVHGSPIVHHCRLCGDEKSFDEIMAMVNSIQAGHHVLWRATAGDGVHEVAGACDEGGRDARPRHVAYRVSGCWNPTAHAPEGREGLYRERAADFARQVRCWVLPRPCGILRCDRGGVCIGFRFAIIFPNERRGHKED